LKNLIESAKQYRVFLMFRANRCNPIKVIPTILKNCKNLLTNTVTWIEDVTAYILDCGIIAYGIQPTYTKFKHKKKKKCLESLTPD